MATERLEMHVLREILRQKLVLGRSHREVVASVGVSIGKVSSVLARAQALGLDAAGVEARSDAELDGGLYPKATAASVRPGPDCAALHLELRRKGVTLASARDAQPRRSRTVTVRDSEPRWGFPTATPGAEGVR